MSIAMTPVVILAGGLATRLRPITTTMPKSLVPVAGRPFIDHQLALLHSQGVRRVVLCTGYLGDQIEAHIGDGRAFGLDVRYSPDGPVPRGTGGALRQAMPMIDDACFVLYGDSYLPVSLADVLAMFHRTGLPGVMTVFRNDGQFDQSNVYFDGGTKLRYSKSRPIPAMRHIDYGLSVLHRDAMERIPQADSVDLAELFEEMSSRGELVGHEVFERFYEIGSPVGLADAEAYLSRRIGESPVGRFVGVW